MARRYLELSGRAPKDKNSLAALLLSMVNAGFEIHAKGGREIQGLKHSTSVFDPSEIKIRIFYSDKEQVKREDIITKARRRNGGETG